MKNFQAGFLFFVFVASLFLSACSDSSEETGNSNTQPTTPPVTQNANVTPLRTPSSSPSPSPSSSPTRPTPMPSMTPTTQNTNSLNVKVGKSIGVVTNIDMENGSIELDHKDIPNIMPAMTMQFNVKDKSMLKGLKVGDKVSFTLEERDYAFLITEIKKQ